MTLDETIKTEENIAEENQRVVDTGIVFDNVTLDVLYCDDTEVIEEHLANYQRCAEEHRQIAEWLKELKQLKEQTKWIPVSEKLPKELEPVNITWVNHEPESYYHDIKDKPFTATGVYFNGQWYWWSTLCTDILAEYSHNYDDVIDDDIEVTAWMPLPEPYKESE